MDFRESVSLCGGFKRVRSDSDPLRDVAFAVLVVAAAVLVTMGVSFCLLISSASKGFKMNVKCALFIFILFLVYCLVRKKKKIIITCFPRALNHLHLFESKK